MPQIQYVKGGPSRSDLSSRLIGEQLQEGISDGLGSYFALKSMDKVLDDPSLKDAPQQEKMSALQRAMAPHGDRGEKLLAQRFALEQQEAKSQKEKITKDTENAERKLGDRYLRGEEADISSLPLDKQIGLVKAKGASSPGGVTAQPIPPFVQEKIDQVRAENPDAKADDLAAAFGREGVPLTYSNQYIESARRTDESDIKRSASFDDLEKEAIDSERAYSRERMILEQMESLEDKGNLTTPAMMKFLDTIGAPLGTLSNPDSEQYEKLSQEMMKGIQDVYGSRITVIEVENFLKGIPTLMNSVEGRKRIVSQWKILNEGKKIRSDAYREVNAKYPDKRPKDFRLQVADAESSRMDGLAEKFKYLSYGLTEVEPGTAITQDAVDNYINAFGGDASAAMEKAKKDGYDL